ncbi:hypothetical protein Tco_0613563, partial [Tanacetum coccineum]
MEKEDLTILIKSLANDYDDFIAKLSSDQSNAPITKLPDVDGSSKANDTLESVGLGSDIVQPKATNSYVSVLQNKPIDSVVKISKLRNEEVVEGAAVAIPFEAVEEFNNKEGMESVLANGPWLIRMVLIILNVWSPNTDLKKVEVTKAPVSADAELRDSLMIAIPVGRDKGHSLATIDIYSMNRDHPVDSTKYNGNEGFVEVKCKKNKAKAQVPKMVDGVRLTKPPLKLHYRRVEKGEFSKANEQQSNVVQAKVSKPNVTLKNLFASLDLVDNKDDPVSKVGDVLDEGLNVSDSEVDEEILVDDRNGKRQPDVATKGASTPVISENNLFVCAILESHVDDSNLHKLCSLVFRHWDWSSNGAWCDKGTRIILGWNHNDVDVVVLNQDDQTIHTRVWLKADRKELFCLFVYARNPLFLADTTASGSSMDISMREFKDCVKNIEISGFFMYRVLRKLKYLKKPFRKLLYEKGNLHANAVRLRKELDIVQTKLDADPFNASLRETEAACVEFNQAAIMEERFLKQKSKIQWLKEGDSNSAYFHKTVKNRISRSRIDVISNVEGTLFENDKVPEAFVSHYEMFLGLAGETHGFNTLNLFKTCLNKQVALDMVREVSIQEIKEALFSMGDDKSPGPDGYTAAFFKEAWETVGNDVTKAICEFFTNGTLLKELNHTIIALIPKVKSPLRVNDYRSISCCNVLFKCISKIIANRIKHSLKELISPNQSTFVPGRSITDNILLTQELMHNYHLDRGTPRCAFKVDIQKAYDTVDWNFLKEILHGFSFHARKRGLRQGDPLSPYLFTLVMEIITLMLHRRVMESGLFTYHMYCSKLELINLCFADDLFLFAYGDIQSATVIMEALEEFKFASGLTPSLPKSTTLMVRYCKELIEKVQIRVQDWKNKSLSIAGRLQLIISVIGSMHIYWASVFMLPSYVLLDIEQVMRGFLWCQGEMKKGKAKVAWELLSSKESLWVKWIHVYKLNGRSFWDVPIRGNLSWGWRKILQLCPVIREFIWYKLGDGANTSLWYDRWCENCPLSNQITTRDMFRTRLNLSSKVKDIVQDGAWVWPPNLLAKNTFLSSCSVLVVEGSMDNLEWRANGVSKTFSVSQVWSNIRPKGDKVAWYNM